MSEENLYKDTVADGIIFCKSCSMPMTKAQDFGVEMNGSANRTYCCHCYNNGILHKDVTMEKLIMDVQKLADIENEEPGLLSRPLLEYTKEWLALEDDTEKEAMIPALHTKLVEGQDCDFTGTQWEQEWIADGRVCHCIACITTRRCVSDIKRMSLMETKNSSNLLPISETLFIPLVARATETARDNPIISDKKSVEILKTMNLENKITDGGQISTLGILARTKIIDEEVNGMISQNANVTIINLGAGLDTRISRMDNGFLKWYDLDLPDVIQFRRQFFSENEHLKFISKSVLDTTWTEEIDTSENNTIIIIAEGLLMYFTEEEVSQIFTLISNQFPGAHMFFDVIHSYFINKKISSTFLWGIDRSSDIEKLDPSVNLIQSWSAGNLLKERQSMILRLLNVLPATKNRSQILHIQFK